VCERGKTRLLCQALCYWARHRARQHCLLPWSVVPVPGSTYMTFACALSVEELKHLCSTGANTPVSRWYRKRSTSAKCPFQPPLIQFDTDTIRTFRLGSQRTIEQHQPMCYFCRGASLQRCPLSLWSRFDLLGRNLKLPIFRDCDPLTRTSCGLTSQLFHLQIQYTRDGRSSRAHEEDTSNAASRMSNSHFNARTNRLLK
jgi:hypothetical protein